MAMIEAPTARTPGLDGQGSGVALAGREPCHSEQTVCRKRQRNTAVAEGGSDAGRGGQQGFKGPQSSASAAPVERAPQGAKEASKLVMAKLDRGSCSRSKRCMEAKLYALLRKLAPGERRSLLIRCFTEQQRLALERWILAHRGAQGVHISKANVVHPRSRTGIGGIESHLRNGRWLYRASATAGPFRMTTGYLKELSDALRHRLVLSRIGSRVATAGPAEDGGVEETFRRALTEEPRTAGFSSAAELKLRFFGLIPAKCWVGRSLRTPSFEAGGRGLEEGLHAWRRLSSARSEVYCGPAAVLCYHHPDEVVLAWHKLREAYIQVWTDAGCCPRLVASRLRALDQRCGLRMQRLLARWERRRSRPGARLGPLQRCPAPGIGGVKGAADASPTSRPVEGSLHTLGRQGHRGKVGGTTWQLAGSKLRVALAPVAVPAAEATVAASPCGQAPATMRARRGGSVELQIQCLLDRWARASSSTTQAAARRVSKQVPRAAQDRPRPTQDRSQAEGPKRCCRCVAANRS